MVEYSIYNKKQNKKQKKKPKRLIDPVNIKITNFDSYDINQYHIHALNLTLAITLHALSLCSKH